MKRTLTTIALLLAVLTSYAQEPTKHYTREGNTFVETKKSPTSTDQVTAYVWRDSKGNEFPIVLHEYKSGEKKGRVTAYVVRTSSKTGKEYKYYLPDGEKIAQEIINENL